MSNVRRLKRNIITGLKGYYKLSKSQQNALHDVSKELGNIIGEF